MIPPPPRSTLFPYTTLFRSVRATALTALTRIAEPSLLPILLDAYARASRDTVNDAALAAVDAIAATARSEEHTSELQSQSNLVCRLLLEKKKKKKKKK